MDSYHKYRKFVGIVVLIGLVWAVSEFSGLFGRCTDACGMEWIFLLPILVILVVILGVWTLVRLNKENKNTKLNKLLLYISMIIPLTFPLMEFLSRRRISGRRLSDLYADAIFESLFIPYVVAGILALGAFLKGKVRLVVFYILIFIELLFLADILL